MLRSCGSWLLRGKTKVTSWSNYGDWVDIAAPGNSIYSTLVNGGYGYKSGTSMASPFVSGLAALVFTRVTDTNGNSLLNDEVRSKIETTSDDIGATTISGGRINAYKAVQSPAPVTTGSIAGRVTDSTSGVPIPGATVTDGTRSSLTDSNGYYTIDKVPEGNYTLTASATDYVDRSISVSVVAGQTTLADFALTEVAPPPPPQPAPKLWVKSLSFTLTGKNLRLDATVTGESGAVPDAQVKAQIVNSIGQVWNFMGITDTAGYVSFSINKAPAGIYTATIGDVTATGYTWDSSRGVNTASYTVNPNNRPGKR